MKNMKNNPISIPPNTALLRFALLREVLEAGPEASLRVGTKTFLGQGLLCLPQDPWRRALFSTQRLKTTRENKNCHSANFHCAAFSSPLVVGLSMTCFAAALPWYLLALRHFSKMVHGSRRDIEQKGRDWRGSVTTAKAV